MVLDAHIKRRGYVNMFDYMITRPRARNSALSRLVLSAPPLLQPPLYLWCARPPPPPGLPPV